MGRKEDAIGSGAATRLELRAWLALGLCVLAILAVVPLARMVERLVNQTVGEQAFLVLAIAGTSLVLALMAWCSWRRWGTGGAPRLLVLLAVGVAYAWHAWQLRRSPVEAVHFLEYALLGLLAFRALRLRIKDLLVYPATLVVGGLVALLDEGVQWLVPDRVWGLADLHIDLIAVALMLVAIAFGLRPAGLGWPPARSSVRLCCRLGLGLTLLTALCLSNTTEVIRWYAQRVPGLGYLELRNCLMAEYGHVHESEDKLRFHSRFELGELARMDRARAAEAAEVLDRHRGDEGYAAFNKVHTPFRDPFLHEVRVHLFRRDRYVLRFQEHEGDAEEATRLATVALREEALIGRHFPMIYAHSAYGLDESVRGELAASADQEAEYLSPVSQGIITRFQRPVAWLVAALLSLALIATDRVMGQRSSPS